MMAFVARLFGKMVLEDGVESILGAIAGAMGIGSFIWLFSAIAEMALAYKLPLAACCVLAFALGILVTVGIRRVSKWRDVRAVMMSIDELTDGQAAMLLIAFAEYEVFATPTSTELCKYPEESLMILRDLGLVKCVSELKWGDISYYKWSITTRARNVIESKEAILKDLESAYEKVYETTLR